MMHIEEPLGKGRCWKVKVEKEENNPGVSLLSRASLVEVALCAGGYQWLRKWKAL